MAAHLCVRAPRRAGRIAAVAGLTLPPVLAAVVADRRLRGPYTAVGALLRAIVPGALAADPDLVTRHNIEILCTTPELRESVPATRETLTSLAVPDERTRFYSRLRTLRIAHGLVEFLTGHLAGGDRVCLVVHDVHEADPTDREFLAVLLRRIDPALLTVVLTTDTPLPEELARYCDVVEGEDVPRPDRPGDAQTYVDSDGTDADPEDLAAYQRLGDRERALLHDARAAALEAMGEPSLLLGAVPYHRERGSDPAGAGVRALRHAVDWCVDLGYYDAVVDFATRGRALADQDTDPKNWSQFITKLTTALSALGRPEDALALYDVVRAETTKPEMHMLAAYATAMLYTRHLPEDRRDHRLARAWVNQAIAIAGILRDRKQSVFDTAFNRNGLALVEFHQGRPMAALRLVDACIADLDRELAPDEHVLHRSVLRYNRAQVLVALGRLPEALADYTAVIDEDPNYAEYHFDRASIHRRLGHHEAALADYDEAIRLSPPFPEAYYNRGDLRLELGDVAGALADFGYTLELDPDFVDAYVNRAGILLDEGDAAGAVRDATAGLAVDPDNPHLHVVLGRTYADDGRSTEAMAEFDRALATDPDLVSALAGRAALSYELSRPDAAIADLRHAVSLRPDDAELRYNLAFVHQGTQQWAAALAELERAIALDPEDPDIADAYRTCLDHVATA